MMISTMLLMSTFLRAMLVRMMACLMLYDGEGDNLNIWWSSWCFELPKQGSAATRHKKRLAGWFAGDKAIIQWRPRAGGQDILWTLGSMGWLRWWALDKHGVTAWGWGSLSWPFFCEATCLTPASQPSILNDGRIWKVCCANDGSSIAATTTAIFM